MTEDPHEAVSERYAVRSAWAHLGMCAATAVLLTLSFPLPGWSFMAWFALVPVGLLAMRTSRLWTLMWTSYLVFFVWWSLRVIWLQHVETFAPLGIAVVCAGYFSLALVLLAAVQRRFNSAMTLTLPLFWCSQEILRGVWPLGGFAWFTLGSSQAAWRVGEHPGYFVQCADLFGWVGVSFLIAMTSGLVVDLVARSLTKRRPNGSLRLRRTTITAVFLWLCCFTAAGVYGYYRLDQAPDLADLATPRITLGVVQTNVPQSNKMEGSGDDLLKRKLEDLDNMIQLSLDSAEDDPRPDLISWPETMITFPINDESYKLALENRMDYLPPELILYFRKQVQDHVDRIGIPVVVGSQAGSFSGHGRSMNSALFALPGKNTMPRYSKMHLVPMGEYIPGPPKLRELFMKYFSPYDFDYTVEPGEGIVVFEVPSHEPAADHAQAPVRFATPICYEDAVAQQCRQMVYGQNGVKRADLLVNLTNDAWYPGSHQGYQHLQLAVMRCIENRVPMSRSVNTGVSGVIDSSGRVLEIVTVAGEQQEVAGHVNVTVALDGRTSIYGQVREAAWVGLCATSGLLFLGVLLPSSSKRR